MPVKPLLPQRSRDVLWVISLVLVVGAAIWPVTGSAKAGAPRAATKAHAAAPPANPGAGQAWTNPADGAELIYIPPGAFVLGFSDKQMASLQKSDPTVDPDRLKEAQPQCKVTTKGYWIGRTEVTNAQYLRFVRATGHRVPRYWQAGRPPAGMEKYPVTNVDWSDADAYARWAGGRLPTEIEWEKAARGTDGRLFPWGNTWDPDRCQDFHAVTGKPTPTDWKVWDEAYPAWEKSHDPDREAVAAVGSFPGDKSPYGCLDMAGNVFEWCADWFDAAAYQRYAKGSMAPPKPGRHGILRGGSWDRNSTLEYCTAMRGFHPLRIYRLHDAGLRYVRDAAQPPRGRTKGRP